jgi:hypothetical protein
MAVVGITDDRLQITDGISIFDTFLSKNHTKTSEKAAFYSKTNHFSRIHW